MKERWRGWVVGAALLALAAGAGSDPGAGELIHRLLFDRVDCGGNSFPQMADPPLWPNTRYLLEGESYGEMRGLLHRLVTEDMRETMPDTRQRALLQHELWQVFDWTVPEGRDEPQRAELRKRLAAAIRKLALTREEIEALPSNLRSGGAVDGPPEVTDPGAGWVSIGIPGSTAIAQTHMMFFQGRSVFGVFMRCPGGAKETVAYLHKLSTAPYPAKFDVTENHIFRLDGVPQFPEGTELGLLRRMILIDVDGQLVESPIVQSLQLRRFVKIHKNPQPGDVVMQEFLLDRERYVAGDAVAMVPANQEPLIFMSMGFDWFEMCEQGGRTQYHPPAPVVESCIACHRDPGVMSMNSFTRRLFSNPPPDNPGLDSLGFDREATITIDWKKQQATWGMLRGIWEAGK